MNSLLLAIQFLTIIPVRTKDTASYALIYFPVVGMLLGAILAGLNLVFIYLSFNPFLTNTILVIVLAILTGALHLDGLSDTFDAFFSGKDRQGMLEIMRDPRIGTMGVLALISVILLKIAMLFSFSGSAKNTALISMCVLSRWSLIPAIYLFPYARNEGKAKEFFNNLGLKEIILSTALALSFICLILGWRGFLLFVVALFLAYFFNSYANKKIGGITGDILGATLELNEAFILMACLLAFRI